MFGRSSFSSTSFAGSTSKLVNQTVTYLSTSVITLLTNIRKLLTYTSTSTITFSKFLSTTILYVSTSSGTIVKLVNKYFAIINDISIVVLNDIAQHLISISYYCTSTVINIKRVFKLISYVETVVSTLLNHLTLSKYITYAVTQTVFILKQTNKILTIISVTVNSLIKFVKTTLIYVSTSTITTVAEYVKKFGAVAKFTFIVEPKKRLINIAHNTTLVVQVAKRSLSIIKSRIILLFKGDTNGW